MALQTQASVRPVGGAGREPAGGPGRLARIGAGLADLCAAPYSADRYIELVAPLGVRGEGRARVTSVRRQTADTVTLTLRTNRAWRGFRAGQYVRVAVEVDGVLRTRCYSPVGSEHGPRRDLELTVKVHPDGLVSPVLAAARPGLILRLSPAEGAFTLPPQRPDRLLLISGGSGITPVLSMLRTLLDEGYRGRIAFLHYADHADDVPHREELAALQGRSPDLAVVLAYTDPGAGGDLPGLFDGESLSRAVPWYLGAQTYLCGPPGLTEAVTEHFRVTGSADRLHVERFTSATASPGVCAPSGGADTGSAAAPPTGTITFSRSGIAVTNDGSTLLEQAQRQGLDAGRGCGMGICFSCVQVKRSGRVHNVLTGVDHDDPDEEVQTCIGVPVGDVDLAL